MVKPKTLTGRGVLNIHTYLTEKRDERAKTITGRLVLSQLSSEVQKPLTGRGVLKFNIHTYSLSNQLFSKVVHFKTPLPARAFAP